MPKVLAIAFSGGSFHTGHVARMTNFLRTRPGDFTAKLLVINSFDQLTTHTFDTLPNTVLNLNPDEPDTDSINGTICHEKPDVFVFDCLDAIPGLKNDCAQKATTVLFDDIGWPSRNAHIIVNAIVGDWNVPERRTLSGQLILEGPRFLVLNPDLEKSRQHDTKLSADTEQNGDIRTQEPNLLIALGGTDPTRRTLRILEAVRVIQSRCLPGDFDNLKFGGILVLASKSHPDYTEIKDVADSIHAKVAYGINIGDAYSQADIAYTGGGLTAFEAIGSGLSVVVFPDVNHELSTAAKLSALNACDVITEYPDVDKLAFQLKKHIDTFYKKKASGHSNQFVDFKGGYRVWNQIINH